MNNNLLSSSRTSPTDESQGLKRHCPRCRFKSFQIHETTSKYCTLCGYKLLIYRRPKPSRTERIGMVFSIGIAFVFTCVAAAMMCTGGISAWWGISLMGLAITFYPQVRWLRTHIQGNQFAELVRLLSQTALFFVLVGSAIYWTLPFAELVRLSSQTALFFVVVRSAIYWTLPFAELVRLSSQTALFFVVVRSAIYWTLPFWLTQLLPQDPQTMSTVMSELGWRFQPNPSWGLLAAFFFGHAAIFKVVGTEGMQRRELDKELNKVYRQRTYEQ